MHFIREVSSPNPDVFISSVPIAGPQSALQNTLSNLQGATYSRSGLTFNQIGTLFFSNPFDAQVLSTNKNGETKVVISSAAGLLDPEAIAIDQLNNVIYVADSEGARIVRASLNQPLPINQVETFADSSSGFTVNIFTMHFNPRDSNLYWTSNFNLYRAPVNSSVPLASAALLSTQGGRVISSFDFDNAFPQNIYFIDPSELGNGIYMSQVPSGSNQLAEQVIFDASQNMALGLTGLVINKAANTMCYSGGISEVPFIRCGDRSNLTALTTVVQDPGNGSLLSESPQHLAIEDPVTVRPDVKPVAPEFGIILGGRRPAVRIRLQKFSNADTKRTSQAAKLNSSMEMLEANKRNRRNRKPKINFRYRINLRKTTDADGNRVKKRQRDIRNIVSKRNELTVRNIRGNSTYNLRYRVEITRKAAGQPAKVVRRTPFSPTVNFKIQ